jgi:hypothetical protein
MSEFLKMDIFFFIATIGITVFIVAGAVLAFYITRILRIVREIVGDARSIADDAKDVSSKLRDDIHDARTRVVGGISGVMSALSAIGSFKRAKRRTRSTKEETSHDDA